jgi:hypothetical protein
LSTTPCGFYANRAPAFLSDAGTAIDLRTGETARRNHNSLFSGKAGFVTGAAGGIGRASAIAFAPASPAILQDSWVLSQVL